MEILLSLCDTAFRMFLSTSVYLQYTNEWSDNWSVLVIKLNIVLWRMIYSNVMLKMASNEELQ